MCRSRRRASCRSQAQLRRISLKPLSTAAPVRYLRPSCLQAAESIVGRGPSPGAPRSYLRPSSARQWFAPCTHNSTRSRRWILAPLRKAGGTRPASLPAARSPARCPREAGDAGRAVASRRWMESAATGPCLTAGGVTTGTVHPNFCCCLGTALALPGLCPAQCARRDEQSDAQTCREVISSSYGSELAPGCLL